MPVILRDYQEKAVADAREAFREHRSVLLTKPTGSGKTLTAAFMLRSAMDKGLRSMFIVNRVELVKQTMVAFDLAEIDYGVVSAGFAMNPFPLVQIASIDTLKRRLHKVPTPKLIVWDECRSIAAKGWTGVYNAYPKAKHLGLDATPERLDGTGLGKFFTALVHGPSYSQLVEAGALVRFRVYAPDPPNLDAVHTEMGEFNKEEVDAIMGTPKVVGNIVEHYKSLALGKRGIGFACSVKRSIELVDAFRAAGINAAHLDGESDSAYRDSVVGAFRRGEIDILWNVNLFSAGFDVPGVEVIIDAAPTQSVSMYLQRAGRGSRPFDGKLFCIHLDHAGNVFRHGMPDQDRTWTLEGREKKKGKKREQEVMAMSCPECLGAYPPAPKCPYCGHVREVQSREVEEVAGQLQQITPEMVEALKKKRKFEVLRAPSLEALEEIGRERGNHENWARHVWDARQKGADRRAEQQAQAYLFPRR